MTAVLREGDIAFVPGTDTIPNPPGAGDAAELGLSRAVAGTAIDPAKGGACANARSCRSG